MHSRMQEQMKGQQEFNEPSPAKSQPQVSPDDYIEFEEVK